MKIQPKSWQDLNNVDVSGKIIIDLSQFSGFELSDMGQLAQKCQGVVVDQIILPKAFLIRSGDDIVWNHFENAAVTFV